MNRPPWPVVFMGTPVFAVPSLQALIRYAGVKIIAVVTQPDRPKGRGLALAPSPVKVVAQQAGLPILQPEKIRSPELLEKIQAWAPELIIVVAYGKILPRQLLAVPPFGVINVHASLLPRYRGAAPIQWALIRGEEATGVSVMQLDEGMDTGPVFLMKKTPISSADTAGILHDRLAAIGAQALIETLEGLRKGVISAKPQPEIGVSYAPMLQKKDGLIDWSRPAREIFNLIRGLDPWPGSYSFWRGKLCHFYRSMVIEDSVKESPGMIVRVDDSGLLVATGRDYIHIAEIKMEGGRRMTVADFRRGHNINAGDRLG